MANKKDIINKITKFGELTPVGDGNSLYEIESIRTLVYIRYSSVREVVRKKKEITLKVFLV